MRLFEAFAVAATALVVAPFSGEQPVTASCVAPTATFKPARIARGGVLTVTGQNLGVNCFDTATVPPGVGPLGSPLTGLAIVVDQGSNEFLLATGSADGDYELRVDVVIPSTLEPGEAILNILGAGDARLTIEPPLVISSAPPIDSTEPAVATFGSPTTLEAEPVGTSPPVVLPADIPDDPVATAPPQSTPPVDDDTTTTGDLQRAIAVGVAGVVAAGATGFAVWTRARRGR